jgi:hypothetical protein
MNATDLLSKAIAAKIASRQPSPPVKAKDGDKEHSYSMNCPACKASIQFSDDDLPNFRTDPSTGSEEDDDTDSDDQDDDGDDEELDAAAKSAFLARMLTRKPTR